MPLHHNIAIDTRCVERIHLLFASWFIKLFFTAFVSIYLSTDHKPQTIGQIRSSDGHCVGTYSTLADGVVSLLVNEGLLTCHDANNVTETIFKNLPSGLSIYIIHSVHDRTICMGVEENIVRCLKTSTWKSSLGRNRTLEQPTIVGGVPAAGKLQYISILKNVLT